MEKKRTIVLSIVCIVLIFIVFVLCFLVANKERGYEGENNSIESKQSSEIPNSYVGFCAEVIQVFEDDMIEVDGLEINNSPNLLGPYWVRTENALFLWCSEKIRKDDLKEGDIVFIQFGGYIKPSNPASIKAERIYYLGDKESIALIGADEEMD
ncbi:MAG: hypothetical protein IJW37_03615 [Lachnospiraceae bacterium]|nr:hypothetical protein [Lachnospiraceae bacterium]